MDHKEIQKRVNAAIELLDSSTTTRSKFEQVRTLIKGVNPHIDNLLAKASSLLDDLEKIHKMEVIDFTLKHMPEDTPEKKKRKKALLLFFTTWKDLKSEVNRVAKELNQENSHTFHTNSGLFAHIARIVWGAKGPLGIITAVAIGVIALNSLSASIIIKNEGCETLTPTNFIPIPLPGLDLPHNPIKKGDQAVAKLPPTSFTVDALSTNTIKLQVFGLDLHFDFGGQTISFLFDQSALLGKVTQIKLAPSSTHELVIKC